MVNKDIITNPNVLYIFDHLKLSQVPDNFYLLKNTYSYSQYLLNKYYNLDKLDNLNFLTNIDIEFKKQYMEKTQCILNTSKIYSRIFELSSSKIHERKYDIAFVGTTNYGEGTNTTLHRTDLILKLKEISAT